MPHICEMLRANAERWPDKPALIEPGGVGCTFRALRDRVAAFSGALDRWGLREGAHVLVLLPMGIDLYAALLGATWGGRTAVLVDPSADRRSLDMALTRVGLHALVGIRKAHLLRLTLRALRGLDLYVADGGLGPVARKLPRTGLPGPLRDPVEGEPALITFTTGTTGVPKAIGRSHRFLLAQHQVLVSHMGIGPDDVDLPTLPVFLLNSLAAGATCVLPDGDLRDVSSLDPDRLLAQVAAHRVTTTSGSPAFFRTLVDRVLERDSPQERITRLFVGGARVRADLLRDMARAFPSASVQVVYGSTEAEPIATLDADTALSEAIPREAEGSCVGTPVPGIRVRLVDPDGHADVLEGTPGEVWVAGAHVNRGYYRDPSADAANKVRDGETVWHRTGDAAWRDPQGRLWLVGRVSERVGPHYPFRVEALAEQVPGVVRAALAEVDGAPVLAFTGEGDAEALREQTGIDRVERVEQIPVDPRHRAKVDRAALEALLATRS
ncbi:MAG: AMP-binding protein [Deltaproteobacteria bacterium]|nr:AMP-binding protein [Deltaproteobacteria bacterium]